MAAANYLPSFENITLLAGSLFFQPDGAVRARSLGYVDAFSWTPNISTEPVHGPVNGVRTQIGEYISEVSVQISMTLKELRPDNLVIAVQGSLDNLTQTAATATVISALNVAPGEVIDLGVFGAMNVVVTDGAATPAVLVLGTDYLVNAAAGVLTVYKAQAKIKITFDTPAILADAGKAAIAILQNPAGLKGVFTVVGENPQGRRYKLEGLRATLRPSGDVALLSDGSAISQVELEGTGLENPAAPLYKWGRLIDITE